MLLGKCVRIYIEIVELVSDFLITKFSNKFKEEFYVILANLNFSRYL